jgi:hypothetical protein
MVTPHETLTAAADHLDARLAALHSAAAGQDYHWQCNRYVEGDEVNRYTAAMNPDVGRTLVALLRGMAAWYEVNGGPVWPGGTDNLRDFARAILATKEGT